MGVEALTAVRNLTGRLRSSPRMTLLFTGVALGALCFWCVAQFGTLSGALAFLNGDRLIPDAYSKSFGTRDVGSSPSVVFNLTNKSEKPIRIIGARSSCTCLALEGLPATVKAGATLPFMVRVLPASKQGRVTGTVLVYSDYEEQPSVPLRLSGQFADPGRFKHPGTGTEP